MPVKLHVARPEDAAELLAIYEPYVRETFITFELEVPSVDEFAERIARTLQRYPYLVARDAADGRALGYAYVGAFKGRAAYDWAVETSIYVDRAERGRHVGGMLYQALEEACRLQGVRNLEACIAEPDEGGSIGFHAHLGYRTVGRFEKCGYKLGDWRNMVWMEKFIAPHGGAPEPLLAFPQVRRRVETLLG